MSARSEAMESREVVDYGNARMKWEPFRALIGQMTLPENFKIRCNESIAEYPRYWVVITAHWPDIDPDKDFSQTYASFTVDEYIEHGVPVRFVMDMVYHRIAELWMHELHEHLRIGNRFIKHPHPEGLKGPLG